MEDFEDPPEFHEALFLKVFAKTKRSSRRINASELRLSRSQRLTRLNANHTSWPPGGEKGLRSYVYSEIQVPSEEKRERGEGPNFDIQVLRKVQQRMHATRNSKFRRPSRYLERARKDLDGE